LNDKDRQPEELQTINLEGCQEIDGAVVADLVPGFGGKIFFSLELEGSKSKRRVRKNYGSVRRVMHRQGVRYPFSDFSVDRQKGSMNSDFLAQGGNKRPNAEKK
jgi:hypothetical protein